MILTITLKSVLRVKTYIIRKREKVHTCTDSGLPIWVMLGTIFLSSLSWRGFLNHYWSLTLLLPTLPTKNLNPIQKNPFTVPLISCTWWRKCKVSKWSLRGQNPEGWPSSQSSWPEFRTGLVINHDSGDAKMGLTMATTASWHFITIFFFYKLQCECNQPHILNAICMKRKLGQFI